jgi:hypothetical protein
MPLDERNTACADCRQLHLLRQLSEIQDSADRGCMFCCLLREAIAYHAPNLGTSSFISLDDVGSNLYVRLKHEEPDSQLSIWIYG